uniref:Cysteine dioxygenase n=1 Tax=Aceria tosichella TaxID=561515 RepID=A0A6G1SPY3_9ACAR
MAPTLENTIGGSHKQHLVNKQMTMTPAVTNLKSNTTAVAAAAADVLASVDLAGADPKKAAAVAPFGEFNLLLSRLERAFSRSESSVDVDEVWRILEDYNSNMDEWAKYAYYDMTKYKRNLVAEYEKYNVMIITWGPGSRSCIHDHAGSHCFMKVLDGELIEGRFAWPDEKALKGAKTQEMSRVRDTRMRLNDVVYIHDKVGLHLVENVNPKKTAASLHVYIPPYHECKAFDPRTGRAIECQLDFYSKCGRVVKEDEKEGDKYKC